MKKNAFTLIELSIVLVIIGLIIGGSFKVLKSMRENAKVTNAKDNVKAAKNAVVGYSMTTGLLPDLNTFNNDLSPMKANAHQIKYHHDTNFDTKNICSDFSTALTVKQNKIKLDGTIGTIIIPNVAFVIISESANKILQTTLTNDGAGKYSVSVPVPFRESVAGVRYDDVVDWMTLSDLQRSVDCSKNKLVITNEHALPRDSNSSGNYLGNIGNASIYADGGYPFPDGSDSDSDSDYLWCVQNAPSWMNNMQCNGNLLPPNHTTCSNPSDFKQCTTPTLDGNPSLRVWSGVDNFRIYVKDRNQTISKSFTVTID